ncbi:hypothetical protein FRC06_004476 [Ceratobasidium sp. 370]|nr:hypothetical protein FRC06_004476 [Ceratobasidium sp. 370]
MIDIDFRAAKVNSEEQMARVLADKITTLNKDNEFLAQRIAAAEAMIRAKEEHLGKMKAQLAEINAICGGMSAMKIDG